MSAATPDYRFTPDQLVPHAPTFSSALKNVRKALGASRDDLAGHAGLKYSTIAAYENENREPSPEAIVGIAVACGVERASAALHGRLLTAGLLLTTEGGEMVVEAAKGTAAHPETVAERDRLARSAASAAMLHGTFVGGFPAITGAALYAAAVAASVREARASTRLTEAVDRALLAKVNASAPLPQAVELGIYRLVELPARDELQSEAAHLIQDLDDHELVALIAVLRTRANALA